LDVWWSLRDEDECGVRELGEDDECDDGEFDGVPGD
jgi:hypothetical protein